MSGECTCDERHNKTSDSQGTVVLFTKCLSLERCSCVQAAKDTCIYDAEVSTPFAEPLHFLASSPALKRNNHASEFWIILRLRKYVRGGRKHSLHFSPWTQLNRSESASSAVLARIFDHLQLLRACSQTLEIPIATSSSHIRVFYSFSLSSLAGKSRSLQSFVVRLDQLTFWRCPDRGISRYLVLANMVSGKQVSSMILSYALWTSQKKTLLAE